MFNLLPVAITAAVLSSPVPGAPSHGAKCLADRTPAAIVRSAPPDYPEIAKLAGFAGTAVIRVDLSQTGAVVGAYVARSTGSGVLDRAAIAAAQSTVYAPETQACNAVAGSYAVEVTFE